MDGFEEFMLLRPVEGETRYFVLTRWASEDAFQAWRTGQQFQRQHAQTPADEAAGATGAQQPVASGSSLLSFEVVSLTTAPS
jgi:heme oxygenase (mycobilin-producing)